MLPGTRLLTPVSGPNFAMRPSTSRRIVGAPGRRRGRRALRLWPPGGRLFPVSQGGRLCFDYNLAGRHTMLRSPELRRGVRGLPSRWCSGSGARFTLKDDGVSLAPVDLPVGFPAGFGLLSSQCGMNYPSPVSKDYDAPFLFTGDLDRVVITLAGQIRPGPKPLGRRLEASVVSVLPSLAWVSLRRTAVLTACTSSPPACEPPPDRSP